MIDINSALLFFCALVLSLSIHEFGHAYVAWRLGDPTARQLGRVTLNPLNHLDPFGTVMIAVMAISHVGIGWAKPVPVNPMNLPKPRRDLAIISFAGPATNLIQAITAAGLWVAMIKFSVINPLIKNGPNALINDGLQIFLAVNVGLFLFNMLPIYPLDGSKIISYFLPKSLAYRFEKKMIELGQMPFIILFVLEMLLRDKGLGPFSLVLIPIMELGFKLILSFWYLIFGL